MLLLLLLACGSVSNEIFAEDAAFLDAFPDEERQTVGFESDLSTESARASIGETADLVVLSVGATRGVNEFIFTLLGAVETLRGLPPAERTDDSRRWGPFEADCEVDATALMSRDAGVYDWSISGRQSDETYVFLYGTHYAGSSVRAGDGQFVFDRGQWASWCGNDDDGLLTVDYDNREGVDLVVVLDEVEPALTYALRRTADEGDFQYRYVGDIEDDGSSEDATVTVRNRWEPGTGGRSDAFVTGGGFEERQWRWSQCWDARGGLTWEGESLGLFEESGDASTCVYADVAEVDRI